MDIDVVSWEELSSDRDKWKQELRVGLVTSAAKQRQAA